MTGIAVDPGWSLTLLPSYFDLKEPLGRATAMSLDGFIAGPRSCEPWSIALNRRFLACHGPVTPPLAHDIQAPQVGVQYGAAP